MPEPSRHLDGKTLCPSARCAEGNLLLGVVGPAGAVNFIKDRIEVTDAFVAAASQGRSPEMRFRFAGPCHEKGCPQWREAGCGVAAAAHDFAKSQPNAAPARPLPDCSIRPACRWFAQYGEEICGPCRFVVTERLRQAPL
jgi:hypothetical protein